MKNTIKYIGILAVVLVAVLIFNQSTRVNGRTAFEVLLSKIPILNNFVEEDYNSKVFSLKQLDMAELRTAYYSIDFLMSINRSGEQFVAIYPYVVEAGYELDKANQTIKDTTTTIVFPDAKLTVKMDNKRGISVIRSAEIPHEYKTMLETSFRNRALDLAFENGINEDAQKNSDKFFNGLFPDKKIVINYTPATDKRTAEKSNKTPVKFVFRPDALKTVEVFTTRHRKTQTDESKVYFNPEDIFLKIKSDKGVKFIVSDENTDSYFKFLNTKSEKEVALYYNFECTKSIEQLNLEVAKKSKQYKDIKDYYWIKYYDPLNPKWHKIRAELWNVSDGYNHIGFSVGSHQYCFDIKVGDFSTDDFTNVSSDLFYLAMGAKHSGTTNTLYNQYLQCYDEVVQNVRNDKRTLALSGFENLCAIKAENNDTALNYSEQNLKAYIDLKGKVSGFEPIGHEPLDNLLKAAQVFSSNNPESLMTPEFQKMFFMNFSEMNIDSSDVYRILEIFYTLPQTTEKAKKEYYEMLRMSGYYSPVTVENTTAKEFCGYMFNMFHKYDNNNQFVEQQESRTENLKIIAEKASADCDKYSRNAIKEFLAKDSLLNETNGQVVLCLKPDTTLGMYKKYPVVIFEKGKITIVPDCSPTFGSANVYSTEYNNVKTGVDDEKYLIIVNNQKQIVPKQLYDLTKEIKDRDDNIDRYKEWINKLSTALRHKINNYCNRPEPML